MSGLDVAVLEDYRGISKYEVDGAGYVTVAVELAVGMGIEGVLEGVKGASIEYRLIRPGPEGYCLVLSGPSYVFEAHVFCNEPSSCRSW